MKKSKKSKKSIKSIKSMKLMKNYNVHNFYYEVNKLHDMMNKDIDQHEFCKEFDKIEKWFTVFPVSGIEDAIESGAITREDYEFVKGYTSDQDEETYVIGCAFPIFYLNLHMNDIKQKLVDLTTHHYTIVS